MYKEIKGKSSMKKEREINLTSAGSGLVQKIKKRELGNTPHDNLPGYNYRSHQDLKFNFK